MSRLTVCCTHLSPDVAQQNLQRFGGQLKLLLCSRSKAQATRRSSSLWVFERQDWFMWNYRPRNSTGILAMACRYQKLRDAQDLPVLSCRLLECCSWKKLLRRVRQRVMFGARVIDATAIMSTLHRMTPSSGFWPRLGAGYLTASCTVW